FYRCAGNTSIYCSVGSSPGTDNCVAQGTTGPCGRLGDGKPKPYGDDQCGDGSVDEGVSAKWGAETVNGENGHRISQDQNWGIDTVNGPFLRFTPLEDVYDTEAGNQFQAAVGFVVFEGTAGNVPKTTYGVGIDDMTVEWSEEHPIEQTPTEGCGNK